MHRSPCWGWRRADRSPVVQSRAGEGLAVVQVVVGGRQTGHLPGAHRPASSRQMLCPCHTIWGTNQATFNI